MDPASPPVGLFNMPAKEIAESLASKEVSPQGTAAGMRLLTFYISHAASHLGPLKLRRLQKARKLLEARLKVEQREKNAA
jgi:hypothetical protein